MKTDQVEAELGQGLGAGVEVYLQFIKEMIPRTTRVMFTVKKMKLLLLLLLSKYKKKMKFTLHTKKKNQN